MSTDNFESSDVYCSARLPCELCSALAMMSRIFLEQPNFLDYLQGMMRPPGRSGHGMVPVKLSGSKDGLVVFGGRSKNDLLHNDTWLLELPSLSEW